MGSNEKYDYVDLDDLLDSVFRITTVGMEDVESGEGSFSHSAETADTDELVELGFYEPQIEEIERGREAGLDVRSYAKDTYDWRQMREIRLGLEDDLDIRIYKNPHFTADQMHEIRLGLKDHLDVAEYATLLNSAEEMKEKRMNLVTEAYARNNEGFEKNIVDDLTGIRIRISDDYLTAYVNVPVSCTGKIKGSDVKAALRRAGITEGFVEENFYLFEDDRCISQEITVAKGYEPQRGIDGYYEFFFETYEDAEPTVNANGTINYSAYHAGVAVQRGDVIAQYHPAENGQPGRTVNGILIRSENGKDIPELRYQGVLYNRMTGKYLAKTNGAAFYSAATRTIRVSQVYDIAGDANYYNQMLQYTGDVHISGNVDGGAKIHASGNILIDGYVGKAEIIAGHNVVIKGGANGKNTMIQAGGKIQGQFFENVKLVAGDDIISSYFANCQVTTYGCVLALGDSSRIIGGNIVAARKIQAAHILIGKTNHMTISTGDVKWLQGVHDGYLSRMETLENEICQLEAIKENLLMTLSVEQIENNEQYIKVRDTLKVKNEECNLMPGHIEHMVGVLKSAEDCKIIVTERIDEGIIISVGTVKTVVPQAMGRIVLNRAEAQKLLLLYVAMQKNGGKK